MIEGCRHLNQPLQERLVRLLRTKPDSFPRLMRCEKLTRIVQPQAFSKRSLAPIKFHASEAPSVQYDLHLPAMLFASTVPTCATIPALSGSIAVRQGGP
jgi:hypothetical protein